LKLMPEHFDSCQLSFVIMEVSNLFIIIGYDSADLVQNFKVEIENGNNTAGINMWTGKIDCMKTLGVQECFRVKE